MLGYYIVKWWDAEQAVWMRARVLAGDADAARKAIADENGKEHDGETIRIGRHTNHKGKVPEGDLVGLTEVDFAETEELGTPPKILEVRAD